MVIAPPQLHFLEQMHQRRDDQNPHRQCSGDGKGVDAGLDKLGGLPGNAVLHRVVDAASRHQRQDADGQKAGDRGFEHPRHHLGVGRDNDGGDQVLGQIAAQKGEGQIEHPAEHAAGGRRNHVGQLVKLKNKAEREAGQKGIEKDGDIFHHIARHLL